MRLKTYLRNAVLELTLALGFGGSMATDFKPQPPQVRLTSQSDRSAQAHQRFAAFANDVGDYATDTDSLATLSESNSVKLLQAAWGEWPIADYDPTLVRPLTIGTATNYNATEQNYDGLTNMPETFVASNIDVFSPDYPKWEKEVFADPSITYDLIPPTDQNTINDDLGIDAHEVFHALHHRREMLLLLLGAPAPENIGASRLQGFGPFVEELLARRETPEQTQARHERLANPAGNSDASLPEYPLLYTESRSYLSELMLMGRVSGAWEKEPANRQEVWAALYNMVGGLPQGNDEVNTFLASREGRKTLERFPAPVPNKKMADAEGWLKTALGELPASDRVALYQEQFPRIWGEIREDLGDPKGLVKMGFAASPVYSMAFVDELQREDSWTLSQWRAAAARIEPEKLERLCELSLASHRPQALQALLELAETNPQVYKLTDSQKSTLLKGALEEAAQSKRPVQAAHARQGIQIVLSYGGQLPNRREGLQFLSVTQATERKQAVPKAAAPKKAEVLANQDYAGDTIPANTNTPQDRQADPDLVHVPRP